MTTLSSVIIYRYNGLNRTNTARLLLTTCYSPKHKNVTLNKANVTISEHFFHDTENKAKKQTTFST